jgi:glutamate racemase
MRIGFFDSGIGGVTVLNEALKILPHEDYIYYADTKNVPYGQKPKEEVRKHVFDAVEFIVKQHVKAIVIACNTATSVAIKDLRAEYNIPVIGMEPAVKPAIEKSRTSEGRVLVTATALTLREEKLHNMITKLDNEHIVDLLALPELVSFAEKMEFGEQAVLPYLKEQLSKYDLGRYETVVLGCTHFSYYKDMFRRLFPSDTNVIDGNMGTVKNLKRILEESHSLNEGRGNIVFYRSGSKADQEDLDQYGKLFKRLADIY